MLKHLLLLVRHFFPRRIWSEVDRHDYYELDDHGVKHIRAILITQKDQFGNLRTHRVSR